MSDFVIVLTTLPAAFDAASLAKDLVERGLAACVNVLPPMQSVYRWDGKVHQDAEQQLLMKTTLARIDALGDAVRAAHPYDVPEFVVVPIVQGSPQYLQWIAASVAEPRA